MASGDTSRGLGNCAPFAASWAKEVLVVLQAPNVTKARKTLPVILDARWTKPVRRALASMWSAEKNSVSLVSALGSGSAIAVSFLPWSDSNPKPSYHGEETVTSRENPIGYAA